MNTLMNKLQKQVDKVQKQSVKGIESSDDYLITIESLLDLGLGAVYLKTMSGQVVLFDLQTVSF